MNIHGNIHYLPKPLPKVFQCGCGGQLFHLMENGEVVCSNCKYIIETLKVEHAHQYS